MPDSPEGGASGPHAKPEGAAAPVLGNPLNHHRAVPLTYDQFRYAFANTVDEDEAKHLYAEFAVPARSASLAGPYGR